MLVEKKLMPQIFCLFFVVVFFFAQEVKKLEKLVKNLS